MHSTEGKMRTAPVSDEVFVNPEQFFVSLKIKHGVENWFGGSLLVPAVNLGFFGPSFLLEQF